MADLDRGDIQGIILRGYGRLRCASFHLLRIGDGQGGRRWLAELAGEVNSAAPEPPDSCVNVAFTYEGLQALGLDDALLEQFSREFQEGMTTPQRQRILGDHGESAPERWQWGGSSAQLPHAFLMLYALDDAALESLVDKQTAQSQAYGLTEMRRLDTILLEGRKEHFGFRDGIAQPEVVAKEPGDPVEGNNVAAGEFILGYSNEYGEYARRPLVVNSGALASLLPEDAAGSGERDLGRNGSYLVMRQMSQDVQAFWRFLDGQTTRPDGASDPEARVRLATKMVGRWPSGAPLAKAPYADAPNLQDEDAFVYRPGDEHGLQTPIGSHVRRTNPRDAFVADSDESVKLTNRHRIIRRGRAYGRPLDSSMDPLKMLEATDDGGERGQNFICFNANIARQFELIQQTWVNSPKFLGMYEEPDPLIGDMKSQGAFVVPGEPVRRRIQGIPRFVQVRGGAYFFMPGLRALRYMAALTPGTATPPEPSQMNGGRAAPPVARRRRDEGL